MALISACERQRQVDPCEFKARLVYIMRPCLRQTKYLAWYWDSDRKEDQWNRIRNPRFKSFEDTAKQWSKDNIFIKDVES